MSEASAVVNSTLVRRAFRRQVLIGALALGLLAFTTLVWLVELHLNEEVKARYEVTLAIAQRALDARQFADRLARAPAPPGAAPTDEAAAAPRLAQLRADLERVHELGLTPTERDALGVLRAALVAPARAAPAGPPAAPAASADEGALSAALDALSAAVARRAQVLGEEGRFLDLIARYTLFVAALLVVSFGGLFGLLTWRAQSASREVMGILDRMAHEDVLTGIHNRRGLDGFLVIELARARRSGSVLSVAMLDLDHFKRYNDRRGHGAGDALLRGAAQAWRLQLRPTDLLARYGGEEFTLVLPSCEAEAACQLIERLRPLVPERQTFSAGVAAWDERESPEQLIARADRALLAAKRQGRNCTVVSGQEPQMNLPLVVA